MKKNKEIKKILLILMIILIPVLSISQELGTSRITKNIAKYWHYRERLKYFVVDPITVGPGIMVQGEGLVASIRNSGTISQDQYGVNTIDGTTNMDFGEAARHLGYYLGVLATEYKLLSDQQADNNTTLLQIYYSLEAYIHEMDECESDCFFGLSDSYNGYFVRSHIARDQYYTNIGDLYNILYPQYTNNYDLFVRNHPCLNDGLDFTINHHSDDANGLGLDGFKLLPPGHPGFIQSVSPTINFCEQMSKEETMSLLTGLELVAKLVQPNTIIYDKYGNPIKCYGTQINYDVVAKAKEITDKIIGRLYDNFWIEPKPNSTLPAFDATAFAYGFASAGRSILQNPALYHTSNDDIVYGTVWDGQQVTASLSYWNAWMACNLAAISDSWTILQMPSTGTSLYEIGHNYDFETFYLLLWAVLYDKSSNTNVENILGKALDQIDAAPCDGPYCYKNLHAANGWASSNKWQHTKDDQQDGDTNYRGNYNGLDYMLLCNLYCIVKGYSAEYKANRILDGKEFPVIDNSQGFTLLGGIDYPVYVISQNNIESDTKFYNHVAENPQLIYPAYGTYIAKNSIILKQGFKVEQGAYFHAFISEDIGCSDIAQSWKTSNISNSDTTSIENVSSIIKSLRNVKDSLSVYPNPNDGNMTVTYYLLAGETGTFAIYDIMGKMLIEYPLYGGLNTFSITNEIFNKGIYTYRALVGDKQIASDKIVVIK